MRVRTSLFVTLASIACASSRPGVNVAGPSGTAAIDPASALAEGEAAIARAQWTRAEALLAVAEERQPAARTTALRSRAILEQARFPEALALARASIARGETYEARFVEGRVLAIQRKFEEAATAYERCAALEPRRAEAWSALAALRLALGDQAGAEAAYGEAAKLVPPLEAEDEVWTDILRAQPDPFQYQEAIDRCARGTAAYLAGNYREARHEMASVFGPAPRFGHCWSEIGKVDWKLGRPDQAAAELRRALESYRPDQAGLRADTQGLLAALLVERSGDAAEAVRLAREAIAVRGERPAALETLARACELARDRACARESYARLAAAKGATAASRARAQERIDKLRD